MKTKINFKLGKKRKIGVLDVDSGNVTTTMGDLLIDNLTDVRYFETRDKGLIIQKEGKYERR